ncbi:MAG: preprotein translocase subunit SecY [Verrucomicrobiales bacterium]|nr:preprotein translocase subunit SecY [Verrucomicrobiales bacterium]
MISAFTNSFKIPELRTRILFTFLMVIIIRLGAVITLPGVNANVLQEWIRQMTESSTSRGEVAMLALLNVFSGGGLQNAALFALGIMPYISASIMMQLLTAVVPQLGKLAREDGGRQKISLYTRYVTIALCVFQGWMLAKSLINPKANPYLRDIAQDSTAQLVPDPGLGFLISTVIIITGGTMLLMWLGEQITERGIGNGVSIIITVNIIFALPGALYQVYQTYVSGAGDDPLKPFMLVALIAFLFIVVAAVISITQAVRKIPVNYAKQVRGGKMMGGQSQSLPLKVNYAGVMPIIFAQAIMMFPSQIIGWMLPNNPTAQNIAMILGGGGSGVWIWVFYGVTGAMIFFFSYFWVATMFQPNQIADDLKKNGGYIPGVRPGQATAEFLDRTMSRLTFAGAIFLTIVAILPQILTNLMKVPPTAAQFFGGTGLLIMVGVLLDIMRQVETHLIQRHYDGFLRKGRIRGRFDRGGQKGAVASSSSVLWLFVIGAILIIGGIVYYMIATQGGKI